MPFAQYDRNKMRDMGIMTIFTSMASYGLTLVFANSMELFSFEDNPIDRLEELFKFRDSDTIFMGYLSGFIFPSTVSTFETIIVSIANAINKAVDKSKARSASIAESANKTINNIFNSIANLFKFLR